MGRTPCCEKVGLKRGRWTAEEDEILTNYIQVNGEGSWRSLPKNAGLLRCGKSCRLRWINYLKTDLKRGNITSDEEAIIIKLRATLGNSRKVESLRIPSDEKLPQAVVELAKKATQQQIIKQRRKSQTNASGSNSTSETTVVLSTVPSIMSNKEKEIISTIANDENNAMEFDHNKDQMLWHDDIMLMNDKNEELDQDFIFDCLWDGEGENLEIIENNNNDNNNNNNNEILCENNYDPLNFWDWDNLDEILNNDNMQKLHEEEANVQNIDPMQTDLQIALS
ncbi:hypothetical protein HAX54_001745 [Datura stramonium]|uniref:Uncharacterized protein n=1 Tax=Datura stramonium TaxID=4076 RepID=A0ABS8RW13_DATST|nr:hypothetical protein [Datura stramonium]